MTDHPAPPPPPPPPPTRRPLSLRSRSAGGADLKVADQSTRSIDSILKRTAPPWAAPETVELGMERVRPVSAPPAASPEEANWEMVAELDERDRLLRRAKAMLDEKERSLKEQEALLQARERYLDESERVLRQRQQMWMSRERATPSGAARDGATQAEAVPVGMAESFERMKMELDAREKAMREREDLLAERERFVEESECTLFDKAQELQEREVELDTIEDQLRAREKSAGTHG